MIFFFYHWYLMCCKMEEVLLFSDLMKEQHLFLYPFPQYSFLLHRGSCAAWKFFLITFDFFFFLWTYALCCYSWLTGLHFTHQYCVFAYRLQNYCLLNLGLTFMGREVMLLERMWNENPLSCMLPRRQDTSKIQVGQAEWWAGPVTFLW